MAEILKGKNVADAIDERSVSLIKENGLSPVLAIFRVGNKDSDISYENGISRKSEKVGVEIRKYLFDEDVEPGVFYEKLAEANTDEEVDGILVFRPLPKQFSDDELRNAIDIGKDVDGCKDESLGSIFIKKQKGFVPCTAQAVIETLDYYGIEITGKNVVVIGRSLVIGKPVSMLLLNRNATVTICHTRTVNITEICRKADILVCASGQMESINADYVSPSQTVIDVGISWNEDKQKLCGDVLFEEVEPVVDKITPVPGGIGSITTSVLLNHVVTAGMNKHNK
ncbi:MAG: bifunctional 5,10-methylene-tetrahydrofolate dehydrogenase/5,10-methylene-tetrahydrofolate cyclohydrolase [Erysipelotrichaceae bacterium]|nr:bifunctional 5,10-methylene-tetrahydrofolate dehydrogenase/5,10-methylene-tetrahydrofolate cyclohydrolase [Erysipelotrichaceae bacterium]